MAATAINLGYTPEKGINYTYITDSSADWAAVPNSTYFYDKADKLPHYKDSSGTVLEVFGAAGGLSYWVEAESTAAPNNVVNVDSLTPNAGSANADAAIVPKGTGALLTSIPDNTGTGGNKRGQSAVDLQAKRFGASEVASGNFSVIAGGCRNTASGLYTLVGGGCNNCATGGYSLVTGGFVNKAVAPYSGIVSGSDNTTSGLYSFVGGGRLNTASNQWNTVAGGFQNTASGYRMAFVGGGRLNTASGGYSSIGGGCGNTVSNTYGVVGGGRNNLNCGSYGTIAGGGNGYVNGVYSTVGGGYYSYAYGNYSTVSGGRSNYASNGDGVVSGGALNCSTGSSSTVSGGYSNRATSSGAVVSGGCNNTASNCNAFIGGGGVNTASGGYSTVGGGRLNTASGNYSAAFNYCNTASGLRSFAANVGNVASCDAATAFGQFTASTGERSFGHGTFGNTFGTMDRYIHSTYGWVSGDSQMSRVLLNKRTTDATPSTMNIGAGNYGLSAATQLTLQNNSSLRFKGTIIGKQSGSTNIASWDIDGLIVRGANAASTTLNIANVNLIQNTPAWGTPTLAADTTNGGLQVQVTGVGATNIQWTAVIETTEVIYA